MGIHDAQLYHVVFHISVISLSGHRPHKKKAGSTRHLGCVSLLSGIYKLKQYVVYMTYSLRQKFPQTKEFSSTGKEGLSLPVM